MISDTSGPAPMERLWLRICRILGAVILVWLGGLLLIQLVNLIGENSGWRVERNRISRLLDQGRLAEAEPRARALVARVVRDHQDRPLEVASAQALLVGCLIQRGRGSEPETHILARQSLAIREAALDPDDPLVAESLARMGQLLRIEGDYAEARALLERALSIHEKAFGPDNPRVGSSLTQLAFLLEVMGDYAGARLLLERAVSIAMNSQDPGDRRLAAALSNLAVVVQNMGDDSRAQALYQRALVILEKGAGPDHPAVALCLTGLAFAHQAKGEYEQARQLYERVLAIRVRAYGADSRPVAGTLSYLASLREATGDYAGARQLYERALAIQERVSGPSHPDAVWSLARLAALRLRTGDAGGALEQALRVEELAGSQFRWAARRLSEKSALEFAAVRPYGLNVALSIAASHPSSARVRRVWDAVIRSRALVLEEIADRHRDIALSDDPEVIRLRDELRSSRARLASVLYYGGVEESHPSNYGAVVDSAQSAASTAEERLAQRSIGFRQERLSARMGLPEVVSALSAGDVLVAYARYGRVRMTTHARGDDEVVPSYLVFVIRARQHTPAVIALGNASTIDALVARVERETRGDVLVRPPAEAEQSYRIAGKALRQRIWDPIRPHMRGARRIFVVPDGTLNLVNLSALPVGEVGYLIEEAPPLDLLSSEKDLLPSNARVSLSAGAIEVSESRATGLLAVGNPDYDAKGASSGVRASSASVGSHPYTTAYGNAYLALRGSRSGCPEFASIQFVPLPGTRAEVDEVSALWRQNVRRSNSGMRGAASRAGNQSDALELTRAQATETAFKLLAPGRRVLHLATHGFFLDGACRPSHDSERGTGGLTLDESQSFPVTAGENPFPLSGLALAGANRRQAAAPGEDDGILTAEEISGLDLTGVEWVVLSACDTGRGEVRTGEGVMGLRRAFLVAGARSLILSLWSVDDRATQQWMRALYEARLVRGEGTAASVRAACLEVLRERRAKGESTHPFYWAAFVSTGDWR